MYRKRLIIKGKRR